MSYSQVGIGTINPNAALDIESSTNGILVPRVALTSKTTEAPVVNPQTGAIPDGTLVWNTATVGTLPNFTLLPGFYYWQSGSWNALSGNSGKDWAFTGNTGTNTTDNFIGTTDNNGLKFRTNNSDRFIIANGGQLRSYANGSANSPIYSWNNDTNTGIFRDGADILGFSTAGNERMRIIDDGRVSVNNTTAPTGSLFSVASSATNPWAVNGYSSEDGSGIYGTIASGSTVFAAVQGEYAGTSGDAAGVRGMNFSETSGTNFTDSASSGITGTLNVGTAVNYVFGVYGTVGNNTFAGSTRSGGVLGTNLFASGALGYYANNGTDYAVYAFGGTRANGAVGGRMSNNNYLDTSIGLGVYGGVIGGWVRGHEYGFISTGERFSSYNMGKVISNEDYIVIAGKENKVASYASTALQPEIHAKGVGKLSNGEAFISFERNFSLLIDTSKPIIVTCTPMGETKGIFLAEVNNNGFRIKENQNGNSNMAFTWVAIAEKDVSDKAEISKELLDKNFENNLNNIMHDENVDGGKAIWSENGVVNFGEKAPIQEIKKERAKKVEKYSKHNAKIENK
jgi:hypothetical protein